MTGESSTTFALNRNTVKVNLTQDFSLVAQVTFINGSFINGTVTIMRPSYLNGDIIRCNMDTLALQIQVSSLSLALEIETRGNLLFKRT